MSGYNYFRMNAVRTLLQLNGISYEFSTPEQRKLAEEFVEHVSNYTRSRPLPVHH